VRRAKRFRSSRTFIAWCVAVAFGTVSLASCGHDGPAEPADLIEVGTITIDTTAFNIERGTSTTVRVTVKDAEGKVIDIPVVWRSSNDSLATFDATGKLIARDTGVVNIFATSLGIISSPVTAHIVWDGPASVEILPVDAGIAVSPLARLRDSIRVLVRNRVGAPIAGAQVQFSVTAGGGTVSPASVVTGADGKAAAALTLGPNVGTNSVQVAAVDEAGAPLTRVTGNPSTYSIDSYLPLSVVSGDQQTGQILSDLPVVPAVKLVDAAGAPRIGVPVKFTATQGGRVEVMSVSTGANGQATPGTWTLGDIPGPQQLIVTVESAALTMNATATGTPIYYMPQQIIAGSSATCGIGAGQLVSCFGQAPQIGTGDTTSRATPTPTAGNVAFNSVDGTISHFCGVAADKSIYCWGTNALADTSGATIHALAPTRLGSDITWRSVSAGGAHNCAIAADQTAYCWGDDSRGQLGDRSATMKFKPVAVSGGFTFSSLSAGGLFSCGLTLDNTALCWGANDFGQLGDGSTSDRNTPTLVAGGVKYQSIGAGDSFACGLSVAGIARCWGALVNSPAPVTTPQAIADVPTFTSLTVGGAHACALTADGTAYCWGSNGFGQLGDSTTTSRAAAAPVNTTLKFTSISAGLLHTCGITTSGSVACWGRNRAGELGDRIVTFRTTPRLVVLGVNP
jgi:hypothetical protein